MGLKYPRDLEAWRRWQASARPPLNRLKGAWSDRSTKRDAQMPVAQPGFSLYVHEETSSRGEMPSVVSIMEVFSPTAWAAQRSWASQLDAGVIGIAAPCGAREDFDVSMREIPLTPQSLSTTPELANVKVVIGPGHYMDIGAALYRWTRTTGRRFVVIQHGLITAFNPPLPRGAHLLAWSEADAAYWISGRNDITYDVVGSQLLWDAGQQTRAGEDLGAPLTYLGQLHGAELPQLRNFASALRFCRRTGAHYRPHPGEKDLGSRLLHKVMARSGVTFADTSIPLAELRGPIVSAFSTGVLEAAAKGLPAYVHFDNPPEWLSEFWGRYGMSRYETGAPTPAPPAPHMNPAQAVAAYVRKAIEA